MSILFYLKDRPQLLKDLFPKDLSFQRQIQQQMKLLLILCSGGSPNRNTAVPGNLICNNESILPRRFMAALAMWAKPIDVYTRKYVLRSVASNGLDQVIGDGQWLDGNEWSLLRINLRGMVGDATKKVGRVYSEQEF